MRVFELDSELFLPRPRPELFPFFADARNLERITPPWLRFRVLTEGPIAMAVGARIDYLLHWHGIPMRWRSEIAAWEPPDRFVDRQVRGPYRLWEHEHLLLEADGGTVVRDHVRYGVLGGRIVHRLLVRRDVAAIFAFRRRALTQIFTSET